MWRKQKKKENAIELSAMPPFITFNLSPNATFAQQPTNIHSHIVTHSHKTKLFVFDRSERDTALIQNKQTISCAMEHIFKTEKSGLVLLSSHWSWSHATNVWCLRGEFHFFLASKCQFSILICWRLTAATLISCLRECGGGSRLNHSIWLFIIYLLIRSSIQFSQLIANLIEFDGWQVVRTYRKEAVRYFYCNTNRFCHAHVAEWAVIMIERRRRNWK